MTRLLITGGHGYLGTVLVRRALRHGYQVSVLDSSPAVPGAYPADVVEVPGDLCQPEDWRSVLRHVDAVVHLAAVVGDAAGDVDQDRTWATNYLGTVHLAEACRRSGVSTLVFASTCSNYGASMTPMADEWSPVNPQSQYARTKTLAEHYLLSVRGTQLDPRILRFATLHGPSPRMRFDLVVNRMSAAAAHDGVIEVHGGQQWRPFLHVRDAADAALAAVRTGPTQVVLNCGATSENYRIADIARLVQREVPDATVSYTAGDGDCRDYRVDFETIQQELSFDPRLSVTDSIREIVAAVRRGSYPSYRQVRYHNHLVATGSSDS